MKTPLLTVPALRRRSITASAAATTRCSLACPSAPPAPSLVSLAASSCSSAASPGELFASPRSALADDAATRRECGSLVAPPAAMEKVANRETRVGHGAPGNGPRTMDRIPTRSVVRGALGTGYDRVEGNRRAWRNGRVSAIPLLSRFAHHVLRRCSTHTAIKKLRIERLGFGTARQKRVLE
jgi:hypothetical protein